MERLTLFVNPLTYTVNPYPHTYVAALFFINERIGNI